MGKPIYFGPLGCSDWFDLSPGDLILFGGSSFLSNIIKLIADRKNRAISHCGVMLTRKAMIQADARKGFNDVDVVPFQKWVEEYDGEIWVKYLRKELTAAQRTAFTGFMLTQTHKPYDRFQAILAGLGVETPDTWGGAKKWYCSEMAMAGYTAAGLIPKDCGWNKTPAEVAELDIFYPGYEQVKGKFKILK